MKTLSDSTPLDQTLFFDKAETLREALSKVSSLPEIKKTSEKNDSALPEIDECLRGAMSCIHKLAKPAGRFIKYPSQPTGKGLVLGDGLTLENPLMRDYREKGAQVYIYLVTCGYDTRHALSELKEDYVLYHFQHMLGREMVYLLGRMLHRVLQEKTGHPKMKRFSIKMKKDPWDGARNDSLDGTPCLWDPTTVSEILGLFADQALGVKATEGGSFDPLHTLLGVAMNIPTYK